MWGKAKAFGASAKEATSKAADSAKRKATILKLQTDIKSLQKSIRSRKRKLGVEMWDDMSRADYDRVTHIFKCAQEEIDSLLSCIALKEKEIVELGGSPEKRDSDTGIQPPTSVTSTSSVPTKAPPSSSVPTKAPPPQLPSRPGDGAVSSSADGVQNMSLQDAKNAAQFYGDNKQQIDAGLKFAKDHPDEIKTAAKLANDNKQAIGKAAKFAAKLG
jgi:hypothetical protein